MATSIGTRISIVSAGALASMAAYAQSPERPYYGWHGDWDWGWGHVVFGSIMMIVFWGGLILAIVLAVRWMGGGGPGQSSNARGQKTALDILEERFARGEIDKEEFLERKRHLSD